MVNYTPHSGVEGLNYYITNPRLRWCLEKFRQRLIQRLIDLEEIDHLKREKIKER